MSNTNRTEFYFGNKLTFFFNRQKLFWPSLFGAKCDEDSTCCLFKNTVVYILHC